MRVLTTGRHRLKWPWLHWCLWSAECRREGCPRDIYVHPLGIILRLSETDPWEAP